MTASETQGSKLANRLFLAAFVLLTIGSIVPLWIIRIIPMQDIWQHLALVDVIHNYWAPGSVYPEYFILPDAPKPNLFYYFLTSLLGYVTPSLEFANKIVLTLYVVAFPLGFLYMLKSFGRSKWLSLFAFPLIFNAMFYLGFVSFMLAMPMMFVATGAYRRFLANSDARASMKDGVIASAFLAIIFFTHAHVFLLACLLMGVLWLLYVKGFWDGAFRIAPFAPSMIFFLPWFAVYFIENVPSSSGVGFGSFDNFFGPKYYSSSKLLSSFFNYITNYFRNQKDDTIFLVIVLLVLILLIVRQAPRVPAGERRKLKYYDLEVLTLVLAISVVLLPHHIQAQAVVSLRHILFAFMFFIGWAFFDDAPKRIKWPTMAAVVVTAAISIGVVTDGFLRFDREMDDYPALFDNMQGSKRLLKVAEKQNSRVVITGAFWHIHHLYGVFKGGITDAGFAERPHNPIQYRPGMAPPDMLPDFQDDRAWRYFDYILVRKEPTANVAEVRDSLEMIAENRGWTLYRAIDWPAPRPADLDPVANPRRKFLNGPTDIPVGGSSRLTRSEGGNDEKPVRATPGNEVRGDAAGLGTGLFVPYNGVVRGREPTGGRHDDRRRPDQAGHD